MTHLTCLAHGDGDGLLSACDPVPAARSERAMLELVHDLADLVLPLGTALFLSLVHSMFHYDPPAPDNPAVGLPTEAISAGNCGSPVVS